VITALAQAWGLGQASASEIDRHGIRWATEAAMLRALQRLPRRPVLVLVDGVLPLRPWSGRQVTLVQGDRRCLAIAAASVLAKQARDGLVRRLASRFPGYGTGAPCRLWHGDAPSGLAASSGHPTPSPVLSLPGAQFSRHQALKSSSSCRPTRFSHRNQDAQPARNDRWLRARGVAAGPEWPAG